MDKDEIWSVWSSAALSHGDPKRDEDGSIFQIYYPLKTKQRVLSTWKSRLGQIMNKECWIYQTFISGLKVSSGLFKLWKTCRTFAFPLRILVIHPRKDDKFLEMRQDGSSEWLHFHPFKLAKVKIGVRWFSPFQWLFGTGGRYGMRVAVLTYTPVI